MSNTERQLEIRSSKITRSRKGSGWAIQLTMSDDTTCTPIGGDGFSTYEDAAEAAPTVEMSEHGPIVRGVAMFACMNCGQTHGARDECLVAVLVALYKDRHGEVPPRKALENLDVNALWDRFGGPMVDWLEQQIEEDS